jgi:hypothetical protein
MRPLAWLLSSPKYWRRVLAACGRHFTELQRIGWWLPSLIGCLRKKAWLPAMTHPRTAEKAEELGSFSPRWLSRVLLVRKRLGQQVFGTPFIIGKACTLPVRYCAFISFLPLFFEF